MFGTPQKAKEIYLRLPGSIGSKSSTKQNQEFNIIQDISALFVKYSLKFDLFQKSELFPNILHNNQFGRYYNPQMYINLASAAYGRHNIDKSIGQPWINSEQILQNHNNLNFPSVMVDTI